MGWMAVELFGQINQLRTNPSYVNGLSVKWAKEAVRDHFSYTRSAFEFSSPLSAAARHVANEEGSCGTYGDANGDAIREVLLKYYAYNVTGLEVTKITGPELVDLDDIVNSPRFALEWILSQECMDKEWLKANKKWLGVGCACAGESYPGEKQFTCYFVQADVVDSRARSEIVPYFQNTKGWNTCSDLCPYREERTGSFWDSLYTSECSGDRKLNREGYCVLA